MSTTKPVVSIVMSCYNSEKWIKETINCVINQTFKDWELLITDDCSTDNSVSVIREEMKKDDRIKLFMWVETKLEHQLEYMKNKGIVMCYTDYDIVNENGELRKTVSVPAKVTYDSYLKRPITCTHSIMFDLDKVDRALLKMPDIRRGQDGATWLQVLKTGITGYALNESLAKYRRHDGSLSSNKFKAIKRIWFLYRKVEHLSLPYSCVCFVSYAINAVKKYS